MTLTTLATVSGQYETNMTVNILEDEIEEDVLQIGGSRTKMSAISPELARMTKGNVKVAEMDAEKARFPLCITWTILPCVTWFLPFIGHTGICDTSGVIYDFAGPFYVSED